MHVQWLVGDKVVQETTIGALEPNGKTQASTTLNLANAGIFAVGCRIDRADRLPLDQENWLVAQVAGELPVLFVRSENESARDGAVVGTVCGGTRIQGKEAETWHAVFRPEMIYIEGIGLRRH